MSLKHPFSEGFLDSLRGLVIFGTDNVPKATNAVGMRFHKLVVLYQISGSRKSPSKVICQCDCGNTTMQFKNNVTSGKVKSCSCHKNRLAKENHLKHGMHGTKIYAVWASMIQRCCNPKNKSFHNYGGRSIQVCIAWQSSFEQFYKDVGNRPTPAHTLDRIDNSSNYEPDNIKWSLVDEQANNKRTNHLIEYNDEKLTMSQAARKFNISYSKLKRRIYKGRSLCDIIKELCAIAQDRLIADHQPKN